MTSCFGIEDHLHGGKEGEVHFLMQVFRVGGLTHCGCFLNLTLKCTITDLLTPVLRTVLNIVVEGQFSYRMVKCTYSDPPLHTIVWLHGGC